MIDCLSHRVVCLVKSVRDMTWEAAGGGGRGRAERFEENRADLRAAAFRRLRSTSEVDDPVQQARLQAGRTSARDIEKLRDQLTTSPAGCARIDCAHTGRDTRNP